MHYIFRVEEILESKPFKERGVGITTNSMCASVHFIVRGKPDDDEAMHQSVQALSLSLRDDDGNSNEDDDDRTNGNGNGDPADDEAMLQSVQALSLTPHDDDDVDDEDDAIKKNDPAKKHK
jgi:hypothetical protein